MTERQTQRRQDAKPQGIGRRAFVTLGLGSGAAALLAACGWDGGTLVRPGLWSISRVNDWVGETLLYSPTRLARTYPASERSAALPSYFISRTMRSEEHTSELQSQSNLVCRLLLEKKTHNYTLLLRDHLAARDYDVVDRSLSQHLAALPDPRLLFSAHLVARHRVLHVPHRTSAPHP